MFETVIGPMSDSRPRLRKKATGPARAPLEALLDGPGGDPVRRAIWLGDLDGRLRPFLPEGLAAHARLANLNQGRLVFVVDAPVWQAKLRLAIPELLQAARSLGLDANDVLIRISPGTPADLRKVKAPRPMSAATQQALQAALASLRDAD